MKSIVLIFKGGTWKIVDCNDLKVKTNAINEIINIIWEQYEDRPLPYYINYGEIIGIFQSGSKKKDLLLEQQVVC